MFPSSLTARLMKPLALLIALAFATVLPAQEWLPLTRESWPGTRWWWLGSAVDSAGLSYTLGEYAKGGIREVEITPIYGVQGNESQELSYLSPEWMAALRFVQQRGSELGIAVSMSTGTGWPFGGPNVPIEQAACKAIFEGDSLLVGRTKQQVKRAAPGGEGFVIDHFDQQAVADYLATFDQAFASTATPSPSTFFNDSYEVYGADWTPRLLEEFAQRRGYRLQEHFASLTKPDSLRTDSDKRILSDYRETLADLLFENFTTQWTDWAHSHGSLTRNQAHGSPANLIDLYAAVDIPECESFGLSPFGIKGLRTDSGFTKVNDSDISMLKYASSGAHLSGHKYTSSETFTWLTEHFRTSLSQCKPDLDLMFVSGVNHVFFHGTCYSPADEAWPGWRFYASVDMSPNNPQWNAMPAFSRYIARCQSFLQWGEPDNDFLVYLPFYDMIYDQPGRLSLFSIHEMGKRAPQFIETIQTIIREGYDVDYISDRWVLQTRYAEGHLTTTGSNAYSAIIVPNVEFMPLSTLQHLKTLAEQGARIVFVGQYPQSEPGYGRTLTARNAEKDSLIHQLHTLQRLCPLANSYAEALPLCKGKAEPMRTQFALSCIRRKNSAGYHYFISNLTPNDVEADIPLGVAFAEAQLYNPMTGAISTAHTTDGTVRLALASGESMILRTYSQAIGLPAPTEDYADAHIDTLTLSGWTLTFPTAAPTPISGSFSMDTPCSWTELEGDSSLQTTMATGCYATTFASPEGRKVVLDLGDVRESARVVVNGQTVDTLFAVPFRCDITPYIYNKGKENRLEVYVTNLPANRIAEMDRQGIAWRKFKEINVVNLQYKRDLYSDWSPLPSGLCAEVRLLVCL